MKGGRRSFCRQTDGELVGQRSGHVSALAPGHVFPLAAVFDVKWSGGGVGQKWPRIAKEASARERLSQSGIFTRSDKKIRENGTIHAYYIQDGRRKERPMRSRVH